MVSARGAGLCGVFVCSLVVSTHHANADVVMWGGYVSDGNHWRTTYRTDDSERLFVIAGTDPNAAILGTTCRVPYTGVPYEDFDAFSGVSLDVGVYQFTLLSTHPPGTSPWQTWLNLAFYFRDTVGGTDLGLSAVGASSFPFGKLYITLSDATFEPSNLDRVGSTCLGSDGSLDSVGHFTVTVIHTPEGDIEELANDLQALVPNTLSAQTVAGPLAILEKAGDHARIAPWTQFIEKGNAHNAVNELNAFINTIQAMTTSGRLDLATANSLISKAQQIIPWIEFFIYDP